MKNISTKKLKIIIGFVVGLQVLFVALTAFYLNKSPSGSSSGDSGGFPIAIWVAIFLPIIISQRKNKMSEEAKRKGLMIVLGLGILVLVGSVFFLLK
jgi:hypothetical protein